jgi:hypothetical protein
VPAREQEHQRGHRKAQNQESHLVRLPTRSATRSVAVRKQFAKGGVLCVTSSLRRHG